MNEKDISSSKEEDLSTNSDASDTSDNVTAERPKHDALIRKALENPIVAKEFFYSCYFVVLIHEMWQKKKAC